MASMIRKSLDNPEETRPVAEGMGQVDLVNLEAGPVGRATFLPGWKWSDHVKPIAKTDSCMASHTGYTISGRIKVVMDDGEETEFGPGRLRCDSAGPRRLGRSATSPTCISTGRGCADYAKPKE